MDADDARAWYRLGNQREDEGRDAEALACFERAVALDPAHAKSWNNLGAASQRLGQSGRAEQAYRTALLHDPALLQPNLNLGRLHEVRGEFSLAADCYRAALSHHPGEPMLQHLLAAASGETTHRAPPGYVESLFDEQAPRFDAHLVGDLDYRIPERLAELLRPALPTGSARILDLGCGTGLCGAVLAGNGIELVGVDLSAGMLREAEKRGIYARLLRQDALEALQACPQGGFEAVVAADVFIYIGELSDVFAAVARVLAPGGAFAFSVEALDEGDYRLLPSGRYAHSIAYLRRLAQESGLQFGRVSAARIRRDGKGYAAGSILLLTKA